jgi:hypothetical protein
MLGGRIHGLFDIALLQDLARICAWWAHTPAKQSACSSNRTLRALYCNLLTRPRIWSILPADAQQVLHMVPHLVRNHVGLRKVARGTQTVLQGFVKPRSM